MTVSFKKKDSEWTIRKFNNLMQLCNAEDVLVLTNETGAYRQEIRVGFRFSRVVTQNCGSFWDRYVLLQSGEIVILWGCVELLDGLQHEEGLWVILLTQNVVYRQDRKIVERDALAMFPVGNVQAEHLKRTVIKANGRHISVPTDCRKIMCKPDVKESYWTLIINIGLGVIFVWCIAFGIIIQMKD